MRLAKLRQLSWCLPLVAIFAAAACGDDGTTSGSTGTGANGEGGGNVDLTDSDGDTIADVHEGKEDPDGDGKPNDEDDDSDGDGIPDSVEAGDDDVSTEPDDADGDEVPNFLDDDSDNNGIDDADDSQGDFDGDGRADFFDLDDDNDGLSDAIEILGDGADCDDDDELDAPGTAASPRDCDGDGPDYQDLDSDGDTIGDLHEGADDTDADGERDRFDDDSDADGIADADEAGDDDVATAPADADNDGIANFRDPDSDNDGIPDDVEVTNGTDPFDADSDDDGVNDLIETAAGTDPNDATDNPLANGDFVFVVPYEQPSTPDQDTLKFRTNVQFADVYFLIDQTFSMDDEFPAMQNNVPTILGDLTCDTTGVTCALDEDCASVAACTPLGGCICFQNECVADPNAGAGCVPDLWSGAGVFHDCNTYENQMHVQADATATANAIDDEGFPGGAESVLQSPACVADPGFCSGSAASRGCQADPTVVGPIGCPGFRPEAVRILVHITDAGDQAADSCGGGTTRNVQFNGADDTGAALQEAGLKYVGIYGTSDNGGSPCGSAQSCTDDIGVASGTVDANGDPFIYSAFDAAIVQATKDAILDIVRGLPLNTTIDPTDDPSDAVDALQFIEYLEVNLSGGDCQNINPVADVLPPGGDAHDDAFPALLPGSKVCWNVFPVPVNTTVPATSQPQIYKATLTVRGDGSPLDSRDVYFLIPPTGAVINPPE